MPDYLLFVFQIKMICQHLFIYVSHNNSSE